MKSTLVRWGIVALMIGTVAGCGGGGGGGDAVAPAGGGAAATTSIATAAALAANDTATNPTGAFTVVQNAGIAPVVVNSPPKANFTVLSDGAVVTGLTISNVSFIIAKLVPGTNGAPDQWVSYIYRTETATAGVGPGGSPALATATQAATDTKAATQLVYNSAGYYTYTFSTDIKDPTKTNGVVFEPSRTHRVAIQLSYTNKAGETVRVNPYFDFTIDANGNAVAVTDASKTRKVADITTCNECHSALAFHGGGRVDTQFCVLCHNSGTTDANSGNVLDLRIMAHQIHFGEHAKELFGNSYTIWGYRDSQHDYSHVFYPQPLANCTKCHDGSKKDGAGKQLAAQGDNWKKVPTRAACGACHQGINFATGLGATMANAQADHLAGNPPGTTKTGHVGRTQATDNACALCHSAADIPVYHVSVDPTGSSGRAGYPPNTATDVPTPGFPRGQGPSIPLASQHNLPAGVFKMDHEIKQVTVTANVVTVVYRVLKDGQPVTFNAAGDLINNVDGSPSIYVAYATTQDGIASPSDWNATVSATLEQLRDGARGTQTGPDASGYYTATLSATPLPADAKLVTAVLGLNYQGWRQTGLAAYPNGIRLREPKAPWKTADGHTPRRSIVSADKCNNCHGQLGVGPSFHGGARNSGEICAVCHDPSRATGHTGANNNYGGGWSVAVKNLVHGIHGASKREQAFNYEATAATPTGFQRIGYPGILKNCEQCHVAGSYDFSASANSAAAPNLLWNTDARGDMRNPGVASIGLSPWIAALGQGEIDYRTDNLVSSPIASACFGCHDSNLAVSHMQSQGGTLLSLFSTVSSVAARPAVGTASAMRFTRYESCLLCHGSGKVADIKVVHAR